MSKDRPRVDFSWLVESAREQVAQAPADPAHVFGPGELCKHCGCSRADAARHRWTCLVSRDDPRLAQIEKGASHADALRELATAVENFEDLDPEDFEDGTVELILTKAALAARPEGMSGADERDWNELEARALASISRFLQSADLSFCLDATAFLRERGAPTSPAVDALIRHLTSEELYDRRSILWELTKTAPNDQRAIDAAIEAIEDAEHEVRAAAIGLLAESRVQLTEGLERALLAALDSRHAPVRAAAASAVVKLGCQKQAYEPRLREMVRDRSKHVRLAAEKGLAALSGTTPSKEHAVVRCMDALRDASAQRRASACEELGDLGPAAVSALPSLLRALSDPMPSVRAQAARGVAIIGGELPETRAELLRLINTPSDPAHDAALQALAPTSYRGAELAPGLLRIVSNGRANARADAARILSELQGDVRALIPAIVELANASDANLRTVAYQTLFAWDLPVQACVELARRGLADGETTVRLTTICGVEDRPKVAGQLHPELVSLMVSDLDDAVRFRSYLAASAGGPCPTSLLPKLIRALSSSDRDTQGYAAGLLGQMGPAAKDAAAQLVTLARSEDAPSEADGAVIQIMGSEFWLSEVEAWRP